MGDPQFDRRVEAALDAVGDWERKERLVTPIEAGRTNRNFRVQVGADTFFLRLSDEETKLLGIDRAAEHLAAVAAAAAGVGPEVIAYLPELGCLVTRWVPAEPLAEGDMEQDAILSDVVDVVRTIHAGPDLPSTFDAFRIVEDYRRIALERGVEIPAAYERAHARAADIEAAFAGAPTSRRPCHNDLLADNFLRGRRGHLARGLRVRRDGRPVLRPRQPLDQQRVVRRERRNACSSGTSAR